MIKKVVKTLEEVDEKYRGLYEKTEGGYRLVIEGDDEDIGALKRAREHEKEAKKAALEKVRALEEQLAEITGQSAKKAGDIDALEKSWAEQKAKSEAALTGQIGDLRSQLETLLVDSVAQKLAAELSVVPSLMLPHIRARLAADLVDGKPTTRVLDRSGALSAMTIEDLKKEFQSNKDFAPILIGSSATGGGASGAAKTNGVGGVTVNPWMAEHRSLSGQAAIYKEDPATARDLAAKAGVKIQ